MNRGQFLKRLVAGVAGLFVAPLVVKKELPLTVSTDAGMTVAGEEMVEVTYDYIEFVYDGTNYHHKKNVTQKVKLPRKFADAVKHGLTARRWPGTNTFSNLKITKQLVI